MRVKDPSAEPRSWTILMKEPKVRKIVKKNHIKYRSRCFRRFLKTNLRKLQFAFYNLGYQKTSYPIQISMKMNIIIIIHVVLVNINILI